jgi:Ala-tRNA(Pro) deacylase
MIIENKKPDDIFSRLEKEQVVYSLLEELNIEFIRADHPAAMTMEICSQISYELSAEICKNLFLCNRQQTEFFLLLTPGEKRFKTKNLSSQIGSSRLSFAS